MQVWRLSISAGAFLMSDRNLQHSTLDFARRCAMATTEKAPAAIDSGSAIAMMSREGSCTGEFIWERVGRVSPAGLCVCCASYSPLSLHFLGLVYHPGRLRGRKRMCRCYMRCTYRVQIHCPISQRTWCWSPNHIHTHPHPNQIFLPDIFSGDLKEKKVFAPGTQANDRLST